MRHDFSGVPPHLKPQLIIFLSVDIVGSTAFKQKFQDYISDECGETGEWFSVIQGFYIKSVQSLASEWSRACEESGFKRLCGDPPVVWKTIGDEIVFRKTVGDHRQVAKTLRCWIAAMQEVRAFLQERDPKLDVKCTAWMGEFPVQNKIVVAPSQQLAKGLDAGDLQAAGRILAARLSPAGEGESQLDFIGPAIDVGFRLGTRSSARKFVVSIDIAYLLALDVNSGIPLYYDGMVALKGVLGGLEYPLFWIDLSGDSSLDRAEDKLISRDRCRRDDLLAFCRSFYAARSNCTVQPFIFEDSSHDLDEVPKWYAEQHDCVVRQCS